MGVDACIFIKTKDEQDPDLCMPITSQCRIVKATEYAIDGATHEIQQSWRFYGQGYERGPWPLIAGVLMALHACENVENVWYFGDSQEDDEPFTQDRLLEVCLYYMRHGNRPYTGRTAP